MAKQQENNDWQLRTTDKHVCVFVYLNLSEE